MVKEITYFDNPGFQNTDSVIKSVKKRCKELDIKHVVVASNTGDTGLKFWEALKDEDINLVSVTEHVGFSGDDKVFITPKRRKELADKGVRVLMASHILSGIGRSISNKFGGISHVEIIAHTLRRMGQGIKVTVEISIMAADAGLIPTDTEIIAVGGSGKGADAAAVIKPAHMNNFFDLEIREIIAMPRSTEREKYD
ncbi:hypothetical protein GF312_07880 [Candidatus Poribacteria bacterium]|nr:hypothetical protein [Candidatus Poribacteria bacterium]